ncbi:DHH family phosphoesterase [Dethiosulfatarculus sandiegensis]|nr:DHH family phosphoesterase [Dethiosulfatarculus sandiegensis]
MKNQTPNAKPRSLPEQSRRLLAQFSSEDRVLIAIEADPDSLASALAMKRLLWRKVAQVVIACANEIDRPDNLTMVRLLNIPLEQLQKQNPDDFTKRVLLDSQPNHNELFEKLDAQVIIDHHPLAENSHKADYLDVRSRYGANSSIMTEYLRGAKITPSTRLATALVYGIKNDTGGFQRPTLEQDVKAFRFLFPKANQSVLRKIEFSEMRVKDLAILRLALDRAVIKKHWLYAYLGEVNSPDNLVQNADFFLKVDNVDSCAVSGIYGENLVIIIRNASPRFSAGKLAQTAFGEIGSAGGHKTVARAEVPVAKVMSLLRKHDEHALGRFVIRRLTNARKWKKKKPANG